MSQPQAPTPAGTDSYRNVAAVVAALTVMQTAVGALSAVGPLALSAAEASAGAIGAVVAAYAAGFLVGARVAPREIARIGHIRAISLFAAVASIAASGLALTAAIGWWMAMQFGVGAAVAGLLAAGEGWVADAAPAEKRGAVLGFYLVASKLGVVLGPFLAVAIAPGATAAFLLVCVFFCASLLPVAATRRAQPAPSAAAPFGPLDLWKVAPTAVIAALAAGLVNGSVLQLYAVFASAADPSDPARAAASFNAAMIGGSILAQWPAGLISDRFDRRLVIAGLAIVAGVAAAVLALAAGRVPSSVLLGLAFVWGAGALSFYGVTIAHAADRAGPGQSAGMMSGILTVWGVGAIAGPLVSGALMDTALGVSGLFAFAAVALFGLALGMGYRRLGAPAVDAAEKGVFAPTPATSVFIADLSPMIETPADPPDAPAEPQSSVVEAESGR